MALPLIVLAELFVSASGCYAAYLYGHKVKRFRWSEYFALIAVPTASALSLALFYGAGIIWFFALSCILGMAFEYLIGHAYHQTLNHRLWTYHRFAINGYTSWLTLPMWGILGVTFFVLSQVVGL